MAETDHTLAWTGPHARALHLPARRPALRISLGGLRMSVPICRRCLVIEAVPVGQDSPALRRAAARVGRRELACAYLAYRVTDESGPAAWLTWARQTGLFGECGLPNGIAGERILDGFSDLGQAPGMQRALEDALGELTIWLLEEEL